MNSSLCCLLNAYCWAGGPQGEGCRADGPAQQGSWEAELEGQVAGEGLQEELASKGSRHTPAIWKLVIGARPATLVLCGACGLLCKW